MFYMDMAPNTSEGNQENIVKELRREIKLRSADDASNLSSGSNSPGTPATSSVSPLVQKLHSAYSSCRKTPSPRTPESKKKVVRFQPQLPSTSELGPLAPRVSPSGTASSIGDSSICGGTTGSGYFSPDSNSKGAERNSFRLGSHDLSLTVAPPGESKGGASSSQMDSIGDARDSPSTNATSTEGKLVKLDPGTMVGGANKGAGGCAAGAEARAPPKRKRKRKSKKPPTTVVEAAPSEFRAKVQALTGMKSPPVSVVDRDAVVHRQGSHSKSCLVEVVRPQAGYKLPRMEIVEIQSSPRSSAALMGTDPSSASEPPTSADVKPPFMPALPFYPAPPPIASHPALSDAACLSHSELNSTFGYDSSALSMENLLLMSMQDDLNDLAASKSIPCHYNKAADSGFNTSMSSSYGPLSYISQADSLGIYGQSFLRDDSATMEGADGDQDAETTEINSWIQLPSDLVVLPCPGDRH